MIKVMSHISVGTPTDFCQDVARLTDEHGISTVVFPWDAGSMQLSTQLTRAERLMESTQSQVSIDGWHLQRPFRLLKRWQGDTWYVGGVWRVLSCVMVCVGV